MHRHARSGVRSFALRPRRAGRARSIREQPAIWKQTLSEIDIPVAIFPGRHDPICPHAAAEFMAREIPNATLKTFEESGHAPLVTESERFVEETVAFIERCEEARSAVDAD